MLGEGGGACGPATPLRTPSSAPPALVRRGRAPRAQHPRLTPHPGAADGALAKGRRENEPSRLQRPSGLGSGWAGSPGTGRVEERSPVGVGANHPAWRDGGRRGSVCLFLTFFKGIESNAPFSPFSSAVYKLTVQFRVPLCPPPPPHVPLSKPSCSPDPGELWLGSSTTP